MDADTQAESPSGQKRPSEGEEESAAKKPKHEAESPSGQKRPSEDEEESAAKKPKHEAESPSGQIRLSEDEEESAAKKPKHETESPLGKKTPAEYEEEPDAKKPKHEPGKPREDRKRKVALLISYNGKGYHGIQVNPGMTTIESELCKALLEVGLIPQQHHDCMQKMSFQRAARTDKGVSAAGNVVSLKMLLNVENLLDKVNERLPPQIRVMDCVRTTNGFNCKNHCDARTYIYILPTYAFCPKQQEASLSYRTTPEILSQVRNVLRKFVGTHNFHNFTSGMKPTQAAAKRYIMEFECGEPYVRDDVEFCVLSVKGQSFILHQIRKMIGLTIAIVRGFCDIGALEQSWRHEKFDVPKAPGLGLVLDKLHYHKYNKMFNTPIHWSHITDKLERFKEEYIYSEIIKEEIADKSMMGWLQTLYNHEFTSKEIWEGKTKKEDKTKDQKSSDTKIKDQQSSENNEHSQQKSECDGQNKGEDSTQTGSAANQTGNEKIDCATNDSESVTAEKSDCDT